MNEKIFKQYLDLKYMDTLSQKESILHSLDPRILLLTTILFLLCVISFEKYVVSNLIPFFFYPIFLLRWGNLPTNYFVKKLILVSPFILFFVLLNPIFDQHTLVELGSLKITGGMASSFSLILRFMLTVSAGLILIALIGIHGICLGLERLWVPKVFVTQILLLYRYLFILTEELSKMMLAKSLRQSDCQKMKFKTYISILGQLFLRSLDRAERIYLSMCSRGFEGEIYLSRKPKIEKLDLVFLISWTVFFFVFRFFNIPLLIGEFLTSRI